MSESIFIVGGSSAVGTALIRSLDQSSNFNPIFAHGFQSMEGLHILGQEIKKELRPIKADLSNPNDLDACIESVKMIDEVPQAIVFLPSPRVEPKPLRQLGMDLFRQQMEVNFFAFVTITKAFLPMMAKRKSGKIVVMLSQYVQGNIPKGLSHYISAKYALLGYMKAIAEEFAPKNIQINAVSPSMIDTPFLGDCPRSMLESEAKAHPLGRLARVEDVVPVIEFLLSEKARFIQGANLPVTGGA